MYSSSVELIVDVQPTSTMTDYYSMSLLHLIHTWELRFATLL